MKSFIRHFLDSCLRSLAAIGQSELTKWGYNNTPFYREGEHLIFSNHTAVAWHLARQPLFCIHTF